MLYKNKLAINATTYSVNTAGRLSGAVGHLTAGEQFNADDLGTVLRLTAATKFAKAGQYVYESIATPVSTPPPPPPSGIVVTKAVLHYTEDGIAKTTELFPQ